MDNNRVQLQGASFLISYQYLNQTKDTENLIQMFQGYQVFNEEVPKIFYELVCQQPSCYQKLQEFYYISQRLYIDFYTQKKCKINHQTFMSKLKDQKKKSTQILKEYSHFCRTALQKIITYFLHVHYFLKKENKQILNGIPFETDLLYVKPQVSRRIFKSKAIYRKLRKIRKTWKKYRNFQQNQNRRRYQYTRKIQITSILEQIRYLKQQRFMTYINFQEFQDKLNQYDMDQVERVKGRMSNVYQNDRKQKYLDAKQNIQQIMLNLTACNQHQKFYLLIKDIIDKNILKSINQYSVNFENIYNQKFLSLSFSAQQEKIINHCNILNQQVCDLEQNSQKKQKIKQVVLQALQSRIFPQFKILLAIDYLMKSIEHQLIKQQIKVSELYQLIDEIFSQQFENMYNFYAHQHQRQVTFNMQDFTPKKIVQEEIFGDKILKNQKAPNLSQSLKEQILEMRKQDGTGL